MSLVDPRLIVNPIIRSLVNASLPEELREANRETASSMLEGVARQLWMDKITPAAAIAQARAKVRSILPA